MAGLHHELAVCSLQCARDVLAMQALMHLKLQWLQPRPSPQAIVRAVLPSACWLSSASYSCW